MENLNLEINRRLQYEPDANNPEVRNRELRKFAHEVDIRRRQDNVIEVDDASGITKNTYLDIEDEEVYVTLISGNKITVERGKDNTTAVDHVRGAPVKPITATDDALIEFGDDFGFSGEMI